MVQTGILAREKRGCLLRYRAKLGGDALMAHASRRVVEGILSFGPAGVARSLDDDTAFPSGHTTTAVAAAAAVASKASRRWPRTAVDGR